MSEIKKPIALVEEENRNLKLALKDAQRFLVDTVSRMAVEEYQRKESLVKRHKKELHEAVLKG